MIELLLKRVELQPGCTIGELLDDNGDHIAVTLEDTVREIAGKPVSEWKIKGRTAIPQGTYKILITHSERFRRDLPLLIGVPGFEGIRIHAGNTAMDTEGCILVGNRAIGSTVLDSRVALARVISLLEEMLQEEEVFLTIKNP